MAASMKSAADDCERPACADMKSMLQQSLGVAKPKGPPQEAKACPVGREELGRATWTLMHTAAAWYPEKPNDSEQQAASNLVQSLAALYPCTHCVEDFRVAVKESPPKVESRSAFATWLCQQHNLVNKKLGKTEFDCSLANIDQRWRVGHPSCYGKAEETSSDSLGQS